MAQRPVSGGQDKGFNYLRCNQVPPPQVPPPQVPERPADLPPAMWRILAARQSASARSGLASGVRREPDSVN